jgi:uncharacterized Zn finger protein (UPF0148 family)
MTQLTIVKVRGEAVRAECDSCGLAFRWDLKDGSPLYCPICGEELDTEPWSNPSRSPLAPRPK